MSPTRIKALPEKLKKNGFEYRLVMRSGNCAIYSQHSCVGGIVAYEVFKIKKGKPHPKSVENLKNFDECEYFPTDEDFGKTAWTYVTLEAAIKRQDIILCNQTSAQS